GVERDDTRAEGGARAASGRSKGHGATLNRFAKGAAGRHAERRGEGDVDHGLLVIAAGEGGAEASGLEGADVDGAIRDATKAALVGGRGIPIVAGVDGRAAGLQGHGQGGAGVCWRGSEEGVM